ncbi:MAG: Ig domain-containing protein [Rhizobiaceae bacterium]|uniref:Ig domain-containing protein n=1 Tax=unclassified Shinella TaxID=2643062 RepID=UPI00225D0F00|nr:Ig domain-containing protein [Shinella sp. YE25]MCO5085181.1 Ig domain-containing protein [Rhizobiaceae bacterium]MDC7255744.1 Ig domain-containing protein [Shinella sp. YE25]CAI0338564.1 Flagellar hook-length control protein fliK [Rhizobiaceae bacterium]CAK7257004.1 putative Ig domain-containing protein [Shinella sp. WSC3-e]
MRKVIFVAVILIASSATAGEIVWRSPTSGTLTPVSDPAPPLEPEQSVFGIRYEPIQVAAGTVVYAMPIGDVSGYVFASGNPLPPGLTLDPITGKITGLAAVAGNYNVTIRAQRDGFYSEMVISITIS